MRGIKFRAWDVISGSMVYDVAVSASGEAMVWPNTDGYYTFSDWPLMQFTGLHDKAGKPIYEGDIVSCTISLDMASKVGDSYRVSCTSSICGYATVSFCEQQAAWIATYQTYEDRVGRYQEVPTRGRMTKSVAVIESKLVVGKRCLLSKIGGAEVIGNIYANPALLTADTKEGS